MVRVCACMHMHVCMSLYMYNCVTYLHMCILVLELCLIQTIIIDDLQVPGWPTPSNWTQAMAKERCEKVLLEASNLRYCDKAVLAANGSYSYADIFTVCMEEIRVRSFVRSS